MGSNAPPPAEGVALAWELHTQHYSYRQIAEHLRSKNFKCDSHETARSWVKLGAKAANYAELLNRGEARWRMAHGLAADMAALRDFVAAGGATILDAMPHLKWLYRELATLTGTDEPKQTSLNLRSGEEPEMDPYTAEAARRAEEAASQNGHLP